MKKIILIKKDGDYFTRIDDNNVVPKKNIEVLVEKPVLIKTGFGEDLAKASLRFCEHPPKRTNGLLIGDGTPEIRENRYVYPAVYCHVYKNRR